ncbi:MAG: OmpA family protein [Proteobacteria bacterium]|nr:OmpA family protein [Pseudomonadota bacterium]
MRKTLRYLVVAAAVALLSTNAMAQDNTDASGKRVSADGSYQFKPSWGIGLQYGMTFTDMANWNDYLLKPGRQNYFDVNFVAEHELYGEWTPIEGFRISAFFGYQSLYITNTSFNYIYGGIEPAFSVRRSFYEFAVGLGLAYGYSLLGYEEKAGNINNDLDGHGILVRPFVEARFYPTDIFAIYLRVAFAYYKEFGLELSDYTKQRDLEGLANAKKLSYAGPNVALGVRFGNYASPILVIGDRDGDGVLDDIDACPDIPGTEKFFGCPNPDADGDGICAAWVSEDGLSDLFAHICTGIDWCPDVAGSAEFFGCTNPDTDGDGVCDAWVSEKGLSDVFAHICTGIDMCPDVAGSAEFQGCLNPDTDGDGICDPWVSEKGLSAHFASVCKGKDLCPNAAGTAEFHGCPNPDSDGDGYCDAWVYENNLQSVFTACKGVDKCPDEYGEGEDGCPIRRVMVTAEKIHINEMIFFTLGKATIMSESDSLLVEIADVIKANPQIKKIEIQGHTDLSGNAKRNQTLSEQRAKSVYDRLVSLGVERERLVHKGFGSSQPLVPLAAGQRTETPENAAKNRRVDFVILEQEAVQISVPVSQVAPATESAPAETSAAPETRSDRTASNTRARSSRTTTASNADAEAKANADAARAAAEAAARAN